MQNVPFVATWVLVLLLSMRSFGQSSAKPKQTEAKQQAVKHLTVVQTAKSSEIAGEFVPPLRCDNDGDLYMKTEPFGVSGIRKLNPKGEPVGLFQPSSVTDLQVAIAYYFDLDTNGEVYQLADTKEPPTYVIIFKSDGSYKGRIKLDTDFLWHPAALAVFPSSGGLLLTGQEYDQDRSAAKWPFTGIFSSNGALVKEITLEDDDAIHEMGVKGDRRVTGAVAPSNNHAVGFSQMQAADDGNVYLMRWLSPAIVYAVSPAGEVLRRFKVDSGDDNYRPEAMHISGNRMAIVFFQPQTMRKLMKVVDMEGRELATYETSSPSNTELGGAFACYSSNPERFTFLSVGDDDQLEIKIAEAR